MNLLFLPNVFECESVVLLLEYRYDDEAAERFGKVWLPLPRELRPARQGPLLGPPLSRCLGDLYEEESLLSGLSAERLGILKLGFAGLLPLFKEEAINFSCWHPEFDF